MKRLLFLALLGAAGAFVFRAMCFEGIYLASESMEPQFPKDMHIMVNKLALLYKKPMRGDVVMFDSPIDPKKGLVKRVVAVEGDTVEIRDKKVYLNGKMIDEPYVQFLNPDTIFNGDNMAPLTIPSETVFVMGDNRDVSGDSRDWRSPSGEPVPFLPLANIKGFVQTKN
ncbi:MAG: Signal peptidase I P [Elusimicrobia bacterium]|nr:Signal peptidase I P [Elusimicrobiota bacterium]